MSDKIAVGLVFALGIVALLSIMVLAADDEHYCKLQSDKPEINRNPIRYVASEDNRALANFVGYLEFINRGEISYLPLELVSVSQTGNFSRDKEAALKLSTDCCDIKMTHVKKFYENFWELNINLENISYDNNYIPSCSFDYPIFVEPDSYYHDKGRAWFCKNENDEIVTTFVIDMLEFEVDGDPDMIKQRNFSKKLS